VVKKLGRGIKARFARIDRQDNHTCVFFVVRVIDYLGIAIEHICTKIIGYLTCA